MKRLLVSLSFLTFACSAPQKNNSDRSEGGGDVNSQNIESDDESNIETIPLLKNPPPGTVLRLPDSFALTQVYERVFSRRSNNNFGIACTFDDLAWCNKNMFTKDESMTMGTLYIPFVINMVGQKGSTINYLRSLRSGLFRECSAMVNTE